MSQAADHRPDGAHRRHHDGTSQTILVGEKSLDSRAYNTAVVLDEPIFAGGGRGHGPRRRSGSARRPANQV